MAWDTGYMMYAVNTPSGLVDGCRSFTNSPQTERMRIRHDGLVDPTFVAMMSQNPVFDFETVKIALALGYIGVDGLAITSAVDSYWQKTAQGGTRAGAGNHIKMACSAGIIVPQQVRASQGQLATIGYRFAMRSSDGESDPVTVSTGQNLTGTPDVDQAYTVGPCKLGSTLDDGVQDLTIDFGIGLLQEMGGGHVYPTLVAIEGREPVITVQTKDITFAESTVGRGGAAITSGSPFKAWLRKKSEGGANVAAGSSAHVLFTVNEGDIYLESDEATHDQTGVATLRIEPTYDGSNDIVAINTGAAIS